MSVATHEPEPETYACDRDGCRTEFEAGQGVAGSFCSPRCHYRHRGSKVLDRLESDHRECSTCFRPVYFPRPVHDQGRLTHLPPTATDAVETVETADPRRPLYRERAGCDCGTTNPTDAHGFLRDVTDPECRRAFVGALWRLADREAIAGHPDPVAFREAYADGVRDWAELAGRSVYGGEDA